MGCLALQETDHLMFETMTVLLSKKLNLKRKQKKLFFIFFHVDSLIFSSFLFPSLFQRFLYNFKGNFVLLDASFDL